MIPSEDDRRGVTESSVMNDGVICNSSLRTDSKQRWPKGRTRDVFTLCFSKKFCLFLSTEKGVKLLTSNDDLLACVPFVHIALKASK